MCLYTAYTYFNAIERRDWLFWCLSPLAVSSFTSERWRSGYLLSLIWLLLFFPLLIGCFFHWEFYSQWITAYKINLYRAVLAPADIFNFGSAECVLWCALFFFFFDDIGAALTLNAITLVGGRSFMFSAWITCIFRVLKTWCLASDLNPFLHEMEKRNCNCKSQEYSVSTCVSFNAIWLFTDCLKYFLDCETSCQFSSS